MSRSPSDFRLGGMKTNHHVVQPNDTLSEIAEMYLGDAKRWQEIARLNGIGHGEERKLRIGRELNLPGAARVAKAPSAPPKDHLRVVSEPDYHEAAVAALPAEERDTQKRNQVVYRVKVPFVSQFDRRVPGHGNTACLRACELMMSQSGHRLDPRRERIQVACSEDRNGCVAIVNHGKLKQGIAAIESSLAAGRPVCIGVTHGRSHHNADGITDHYLVINEVGIDNSGRKYFAAIDPSTKNPAEGQGKRFYLADNGNLVHEGDLARGYVKNRRLELSTVLS